MPRLSKDLLIGAFLLLAPINLIAQEISKFSHQIEEGKIKIGYTLSGQSTDRYEVTLFSSVDNFETPLTLVEGDVGKDIVPGDEKTITWDARNELGEFKGNLSLKLKTRFIPFMVFDIELGETFRRGKSQDISWQPDSTLQNIKLELYQSDLKVQDIEVVKFGNIYTWNLPKILNLGLNYKIKGLGENGRFAYSEPFMVKRKIPLLFWILPAGAVITTVLILTSTDSTEGDNWIPEPIGPS